ncbi:MAG TPA: class I SAM-dependent methyltransferase [Nitrospira sp.]
MGMSDSWKVTYPHGSIEFIDAFRRTVFDYDEVDRVLDEFFGRSGTSVRRLCELGAGTGTHLMRLAGKGYECTGVDADEESVAIARLRTLESGADLSFQVLDVKSALPQDIFDAAMVLFVPISISDMHELAVRAADIIRPGGFFVSLMLAEDPEYADKPTATYRDMEFALRGEQPVIRFNFYWKKQQRIDWEAVYMFDPGDGVRLERNLTRLDPLSGESHLELPTNIYRYVERLDISRCKATQRPPMAVEVLDVFQRV